MKSTSFKDDYNSATDESPVEAKSLTEVTTSSGTAVMTNCPGKGNQPDRESVKKPFFSARFSKVVPSIAEIIEAGFVCFLNPESLEIECVSGKMLDNPEAFYASSNDFSRHKPFNHLLWNSCLMFEPVPEDQLFQLIEDFMQHLSDHPFRDKLVRLMKKQKPYAKINALIAKSKHSACWVGYKVQHIESHVRERLAFLLPDYPEKFQEYN